MDFYKNRIVVIAGKSQSGIDAPLAIVDLCDALQRALPDCGAQSDDDELNRATLHTAMRAKVVDVPDGIEIDWAPNDGHYIDPETGLWIETQAPTAVSYDVTYGGETYRIGAGFDA